jgi:hypothetical protein
MELARCMSELSQDQAMPLAAATALFRPCPHKSRQHNARNDGARDHQNLREINVHRLSLSSR